jgi:hypothetical protein
VPLNRIDDNHRCTLHLSRRVNALQHTEQFIDAAIEIGPILGWHGFFDKRLRKKNFGPRTNRSPTRVTITSSTLFCEGNQGTGAHESPFYGFYPIALRVSHAIRSRRRIGLLAGGIFAKGLAGKAVTRVSPRWRRGIPRAGAQVLQGGQGVDGPPTGEGSRRSAA